MDFASTHRLQIERKKRAQRLLAALKRLFPRASCALQYKTPWELLVAVILSAQCTDIKVNEVTQALFKKYTTIDDYASAHQKTFERDIRSTGFFRVKTRHIIKSARIIKNQFSGRVPRSMRSLCLLPGVGRKTAHIVLGNVFDTIEGIAVDTHVRRFALKFDLSSFSDPVRIERDLMRLIPRSEWFYSTYRIIEYGRKVCPARKHICDNHPLSLLYPQAARRWPRSR